MIPRKDATFHSLPNHFLKGLYLTGMPRKFLGLQEEKFIFRGEKVSKGVLSLAVQKKSYEQFLQFPPGEQQFTLFHSSPTDQQAIQCACEVLKEHYKQGFKSFEFVSAHEPIPTDPARIKSVYVILGGHTMDPDTVHQIRRWVRAPLGAAIWVTCGGENIWDWTTNKLGVKPNFLFSVRDAGISVG